MSKVVKSVKRGVKSLGKELERGVEFGGRIIGQAGDSVMDVADALGEAITGPVPEMPTIPEPAVVGATPGTIAQGSPNVDIGATEGRRRTTGSAKGSRKLRVPLGGLR
jgi:hypothetical protein